MAKNSAKKKKKRVAKQPVKSKKVIEQPKKKSRKILTPNQRKFVQELGTGKNIRDAALAAFDTNNPNTAAVTGSRTLDMLEEQFPDLLKRILPDEKLISTVGEALEANKSWFSKAKGEMVTEEDHFIRLKAAELGFKLKGKFKEAEETHNFNFTVTRGDDMPTISLIEPEPGEQPTD